MCAQMTWNARSVPSGGCNGGGAAWRGMHRAYLFRQGHEQARGGCIDATTTLARLQSKPFPLFMYLSACSLPFPTTPVSHSMYLASILVPPNVSSFGHVSRPCLSLACALVCQSSDRLSIHVEFECFLRFLSVLPMRYPDAALQQCYP